MLHKTKGIVLNYIKYRDTSVIVHIYTQAFGIQSYIENGVRSSKSKNKIALFQPLTLLDMVVYHKKEKSIQRISELKCYHPFKELPFHFAKSSLALFLTEVLSKTLKEEIEDENLFSFLEQSIIWLDQAPNSFENFHLQFLIQLTSHLGFMPTSGEELLKQLAEHNILHPEAIISQMLTLLIENPYGFPHTLTREHRQSLLKIILYYYKLHLDDFPELKSLNILQEMMR
jgi:DNA repair protein RecO (recombination protein O)